MHAKPLRMNESHRKPRRAQLSVTLDPALREALARAAAAQHRTASNFVKLVLAEALADRRGPGGDSEGSTARLSNLSDRRAIATDRSSAS